MSAFVCPSDSRHGAFSETDTDTFVILREGPLSALLGVVLLLVEG